MVIGLDWTGLDWIGLDWTGGTSVKPEEVSVLEIKVQILQCTSLNTIEVGSQ